MQSQQGEESNGQDSQLYGPETDSDCVCVLTSTPLCQVSLTIDTITIGLQTVYSNWESILSVELLPLLWFCSWFIPIIKCVCLIAWSLIVLISFWSSITYIGVPVYLCTSPHPYIHPISIWVWYTVWSICWAHLLYKHIPISSITCSKHILLVVFCHVC